MLREKGICTLAAAMVISVCAVGVANATSLPAGNRNPAILSGSYGYNFSGGDADQGSGNIAVGSGTIKFDGRGNVISGIVNCNNGGEFTSNITGGAYTVNNDGTGFITINTDTEVCGDQPGIDLRISIVNGGARVLLSTDGSNLFYPTGGDGPAAGEFDKL